MSVAVFLGLSVGVFFGGLWVGLCVGLGVSVAVGVGVLVSVGVLVGGLGVFITFRKARFCAPAHVNIDPSHLQVAPTSGGFTFSWMHLALTT